MFQPEELTAKLCQSNGEITNTKLARAGIFPTAIYWKGKVYLCGLTAEANYTTRDIPRNMKIRLYQEDGSFAEHILVAVTRFPLAISCEGFFYIHVAAGHYALMEYYLIPPAAIEIDPQ